MVSRRRRAEIAAYVAGLLMVVSNSTGSTALWRLGAELAAVLVPWLSPLFFWGLVVISILAGLGGFTVLLGGWFVSKRWTTAAKVLITIGVGTGILGLAAHLLLAVAGGNDPVIALLRVSSTVSGAAVLLSIYARWQL